MNELTPLNDEQKKSVEAFGEAMQHEVIPAVLKDRDERFYAAIQQAIKDPMTPGGVQAAYAVLLDDNAALRTQARELARALKESRREICPFMYGSPQESAWLQADKDYQCAHAVLKEGA